MAYSLPLFVLFLAIPAHADSKSSGDRPSATALTKVLEMLKDMAGKGIKDMQDEQIEYARHAEFCEQEAKVYKKEIKKQGKTIENVEADIGVLQFEVKELGKEILALGEKIEQDSAAITAADKKRAMTNKEYLAESQDYSESIDAIAAALHVLNDKARDLTGNEPVDAASLLQVSQRKGMPAEAQSAIASFLGAQNGGFDLEGSPPEANAYEYQTGGIITMLEKLTDTFNTKLDDCQKREMNAKHAYEMVVADLRASIEMDKQTRGEKSATKSQKEETIAKLQHTLATTSNEKADDEKALKNLIIDCKTKASSYVYKQQLRQDEITAINQAVEILGGKPVEFSKHLEDMRTSTALTQFMAKSGAKARDADNRQRVRDFLTAEGIRLKSKTISLLAEKLQKDPFQDIKELLDKMATRLMNEAHDDAEHQGFCDVEVGKSRITRTKLTQDIEATTSDLESTKALLIRLGEEIAATQKELKELEEALNQATALRMAEKKNNMAKIEESKYAGAMVEKATMVLKNFYEMASGNTASAEARSVNPKMGTPEWEVLGTNKPYTPEPRATFGKVFKGQQETAGGVVALLEVIQSDFETVVTTTTQNEADAALAHRQYAEETRRNMIIKQRDNELTEADRVEEETREASLTNELKAKQKEMAAAENYFKNLEPQCFDAGTTFEKRQEDIQKEIDSLEEALKLLNNAVSL